MVQRLAPRVRRAARELPAGLLARFGLDHATLSVDNPGIIVTHVSGFGQTGPRASEAGFGSIGEAVGGIRHTTGDPDRPPARAGVSLGDSLAAMFAVIGTLAALHERATSGRGQEVDVAIYEAVAALMESSMADYAVEGVIRNRSGGTLPGVAPSNAYPTIGWLRRADRRERRRDLRPPLRCDGSARTRRRRTLRHALGARRERTRTGCDHRRLDPYEDRRRSPRPDEAALGSGRTGLHRSRDGRRPSLSALARWCSRSSPARASSCRRSVWSRSSRARPARSATSARCSANTPTATDRIGERITAGRRFAHQSSRGRRIRSLRRS